MVITRTIFGRALTCGLLIRRLFKRGAAKLFSREQPFILDNSDARGGAVKHPGSFTQRFSLEGILDLVPAARLATLGLLQEFSSVMLSIISCVSSFLSSSPSYFPS